MRQQPFASPGEALAHYGVPNTHSVDFREKPGLPGDVLEHHGVKGMRWGIRKKEVHPDLADVPKKTRKTASSDAEEFTRAKLYFGEGAGTRRKLIKAKVEERKKDPLYAKAFDHFVKQTDLAKRSDQAKKQRKRTDRKKSLKRNLKDLVREGNQFLEYSDTDEAAVVRKVLRGTEFLEHHGVKGMKWGVRKDEDSTAGNPVAVVYATVILGATIVSLVKSHKEGKVLADESGEKAQEANKAVAWAKKPELAKQPMSVDDIHSNVVKQVNPKYGAPGTKMNCRRCTFTYEMRRRGLDVKATPTIYATGQDISGVRSATMKTDWNKHKFESPWGEKKIGTTDLFSSGTKDQKSQLIFSSLAKHPNGARGELAYGWKFGGGHSVAWEVVGGKPVIFDTQNGKVYRDAHSFRKQAGAIAEAGHTRTDNVKLDEDYLRRWMTNV